MSKLKTIIIGAIMGAFVSSGFAQNVEFEKDNFKDRKQEFKEAMKEIKAGDEYWEEGPWRYVLAIPHYEKAYKFNPNSAMLNFKLGNCYLNSVSKYKAQEYFLKAYKLNPTVHRTIHFCIAQGYHLNYEWDKAVYEFELYRKTLSQKDDIDEIFLVNKKIEECKTGKRLMQKPERVWIDNLGPEVNSKYAEYSPLITADESVIMFTARRDNTVGEGIDEGDSKYFEDIYLATKKDGKWEASKNIGKPINSENHDATAGLSPDGQTLYIFYGRKKGGDIYVSKLENGIWTKPEALGKNINTDYHESTACLSYDGKQLYFVTDKPGGFGGRDVYISTWDEEKEKWGPGENIGPAINTKYDEAGVFIHPDGQTMYFASKGHETMGGYDIFYTKFKEGKWTKPINIGYPINTPDDDVHFVVSASGRHGYYSSFRKDGVGEKDLYLVTFLGPEKQPLMNNEDNLMASLAQPVKEKAMEPKVEVRASRLAILKGMIRNAKTLEPIEAKIELIDNDKNALVSGFKSDAKSGKYLVSLPAGKNYGIAVKADGYLFHSENFNIPDSAGYREYEKNIDLKQIEVGNTIVLRNIFFDTDKYSLRKASTNELERLTKLLKDNPTIRIEISGHTDSQGSDEHNETLSHNRAKTVVEYLTKNGIAGGRLEYKGYGEKQPIASNKTAEGRQENRRTEFKILSK